MLTNVFIQTVDSYLDEAMSDFGLQTPSYMPRAPPSSPVSSQTYPSPCEMVAALWNANSMGSLKTDASMSFAYPLASTSSPDPDFFTPSPTIPSSETEGWFGYAPPSNSPAILTPSDESMNAFSYFTPSATALSAELDKDFSKFFSEPDLSRR